MPEIFQSITTTEVTLKVYLICMAAAFLCGLLTSCVSLYKSEVSKSFAVSLLLLPAVVQTVIMMVNGNIGTGVAVMGAFSLIRFRSIPAKAQDIVMIFIAMTSGLACAAGYVGIAILFTLIICFVLFTTSRATLKFERKYDLRITLPENLNFNGAFEDIFKQYTVKHQVVKIKTTNMGSLYKLLYRIELKHDTDTKAFIDALRTRNGNLEITICQSAECSEEL